MTAFEQTSAADEARTRAKRPPADLADVRA
jgi:hypothetical protein